MTFLNPIEEAYLSGMREKMEKRIEKAELNLSIQEGIEVDHKKKQELETQWILHRGTASRMSISTEEKSQE